MRKGREKQAAGAFFESPPSKMRSIPDRAQANYGILFDSDQWRLKQATVEASEETLVPLGDWDTE